MAIVGAVEIDLVAKVAKLQDDLNRATRSIDKFGGDAKRSFASMEGAVANVGRGIAALVSVAAITRLSSFAKGVAESADELINTSNYLGISTDKLSAFQHQALLSGVSTDAMNSALSKFSKNLGEAIDGTGPAANAIRGLGLSVEKLTALSPDEAFLQIGEAINQLDTQSAKAAATTAIFGKSAIGLINVFSGGRGAFDAASQEVEKFGLSLSALDAKKIQELDDAFDRLAQSIKGSAQSLIVDMSSGLTKAIGFFTDLVSGGEEGAVSIAGMNKEIEETVSKLEDAEETLSVMRRGKTFLGFDTGLQHTADEIKAQEMQIEAIRNQIVAESKHLNEMVVKARPGGAGTQSAIGIGDKEWSEILAKSSENYNTLTGINDEAWVKIIERSQAAYDHMKEMDAVNTDSHVQVFRHRNAIILSERELLNENMFALEEAMSMDMAIVWEKRQKMEVSALQNRSAITSSILGSLSSLVDGKSRKQFEASKALARSETIVSTFAAAQLAYHSQLVVPSPDAPFRAAAAAGAAVLAGLARLKSINSTSYGSSSAGGGSGGGGGAGGGSSGGASSTSGASPPESPRGSGGTTQFNIVGEGVFSTDLFNKMMEKMADAFNRGDQVVIKADSRQGRVLSGAAA